MSETEIRALVAALETDPDTFARLLGYPHQVVREWCAGTYRPGADETARMRRLCESVVNEPWTRGISEAAGSYLAA
jgi:DNA-binding transcriptional regulator YiaG